MLGGRKNVRLAPAKPQILVGCLDGVRRIDCPRSREVKAIPNVPKAAGTRARSTSARENGKVVDMTGTGGRM